jgi:hypothetical protein
MIYASNQRFQAKQPFGIQQDQFEILWVMANDSAHLPDMLVKKTSTRNCRMVLYTQKLRNVGKTIIINHPFGNGVDHLFMVIWGMVYCCFNHIACLGSFVPQFDPHHQCSVKAFHSVGIPCADGRSVHARLTRA